MPSPSCGPPGCDRDEVAYGTTRKGEPFKNAAGVVSRKSVADLVV